MEAGGILLTPALRHGLLPDVLWRELIEAGRAREADLRLDDIFDGRRCFVGSSLRGLREAVFGGIGHTTLSESPLVEPAMEFEVCPPRIVRAEGHRAPECGALRTWLRLIADTPSARWPATSGLTDDRVRTFGRACFGTPFVICCFGSYAMEQRWRRRTVARSAIASYTMAPTRRWRDKDPSLPPRSSVTTRYSFPEASSTGTACSSSVPSRIWTPS